MTYHHLTLSCLGAAKASGTQQGFLVPQKMWLCSPRPACAHPLPGGFAGALAGGGAPGRHPLICRCSNFRYWFLDFGLSVISSKIVNPKSKIVSPAARQGTSTSSAVACAAAHALILSVLDRTCLSRPYDILALWSISYIITLPH